MTSSNRPALAEPLDDADVPVAELVTTTRRQESRAVMATVAALRDIGVPVRDIAVVARDLDHYEEPLYRAALQYGVTPVFWVQLRVTQTRPYALIRSVCEALASDTVTKETLCRPLEHRWCPPSASSEQWPLDPVMVQEVRQTLSEQPQTLGEWCDELESVADIDQRVIKYVEWLDKCPEPTPAAVTDVLGEVVEAYEEVGLPVTKQTDSSALIETERDARAVVRVKTLVEQLRYKYADRLDDETIDKSWSSVVELSQLIATQRPGRREHSNARAIDIFEANDVWVLDVPYIIAVGLVDGEWPQQTESVFTPELQEEILRGQDRVGTLAPRTAWTAGRDRDQFDDTMRAAGAGLVLTRHTEDSSGEERRQSPLLESLETDVISDEERRRLLSPERELPETMREMIDQEVIDDE